MKTLHLDATTLLATLLVCALPIFGAGALTGGPDGGGYYFIDSAEAGGPVFGWIDISRTGTGLGDYGTESLNKPFTIDLKWTS